MAGVLVILELFALATIAQGKFVVVNEAMDKALAAYAKKTIDTGTNVVPMDDFEGMGVSAKGVRVGDVSTVSRVGDALAVDIGPGEMMFAASFTLKKLWEHVDNYTVLETGHSFAADISIEDNLYTMRARISKPKGGQCSTHWDLFRVDDFGKVTMQASLEEYNGTDVTDMWRNKVRPYLNGLYSSKAYLEFMNKNADLCIE